MWCIIKTRWKVDCKLASLPRGSGKFTGPASQSAEKGWNISLHPEVRSKYPSRAMQFRRSLPVPRVLWSSWKFRKMRRTVRASVVYSRVTKPMRYLTFTASPSKEVRKAILRHRSDVLQIAAIYFATSRHRVLGAQNFHFVLSRWYI